MKKLFLIIIIISFFLSNSALSDTQLRRFKGVDTTPSYSECKKAIINGVKIATVQKSAFIFYNDRMYTVAPTIEGFVCYRSNNLE